MTSVLTALGVGAGVDSKALVAELAAAAREGRDKLLATKTVTNTAKISALGNFGAALSEFATAFEIDAQDDTVSTAKLLNEFVVGFNQVRGIISTAIAPGGSGVLLGDPGLRAAALKLSQLPLMVLAGGATARSLSDLGLATNRDGSLRIDRVKLTTMLTTDPIGVRTMLTAGGGLGTELTALRDVVIAKGGVIDASTSRYMRTAAALGVQKERIESNNAKLIERLTKSFSQMDRQVALIKASQAYLTQQIAAWNSTSN